MQASVETTGKLERRMQVQVPAERVAAEIAALPAAIIAPAIAAAAALRREGLLQALGKVPFARADVVGPKVSGELFRSGLLALGLLAGILAVLAARMVRPLPLAAGVKT